MPFSALPVSPGGVHTMRPIRPSLAARPGAGSARRRPSPVLAAAGLATTLALALTTTACGPDGGDGGANARASASATGDGRLAIPDDIKQKLKQHGIDVDKWKNGAWKNWNKADWLREADDFVNPIIKG